MLKLWKESVITNCSLKVADSVLCILCAILKAETIIEEKLSKDQKTNSPAVTSSPSSSRNNANLILVASAPTTSADAAAAAAANSPESVTAAASEAAVTSDPNAGPVPSTTTATSSSAPLPSSESDPSAASEGSGGDQVPSSAPLPVPAPVPNEDEEEEEEEELGLPEVNRAQLQALVDMGFPESRCMEAIAQTNSVEQATEFLLLSPHNDNNLGGLGILGGLGAEEDGDVYSEDAQMMQAIQMSLSAHMSAAVAEVGAAVTEAIAAVTTAQSSNTDTSTTTVSTISTTSSNSLSTTTTTDATPAAGPSTSADDNGASSSTTLSAAECSRARTFASNKSLKINIVKQLPPVINDKPMRKEKLEEFMETVLEGCLSILDHQADIVHKVCDLLTTCCRRNGTKWKHDMLNRLLSEVNVQAMQLTASIDDGVEKLCKSDLSTKFASRLHLITLLLGEFTTNYTDEISCEELVQNLCNLLCETERVLSSSAHFKSKSQTASPTEDSSTTRASSSTKPTFSSSVSSLLLPSSLALGEYLHSKEPSEKDNIPTPKWISASILLIDLYEKIFLSSKRRLKMIKVRGFNE